MFHLLFPGSLTLVTPPPRGQSPACVSQADWRRQQDLPLGRGCQILLSSCLLPSSFTIIRIRSHHHPHPEAVESWRNEGGCCTEKIRLTRGWALVVIWDPLFLLELDLTAPKVVRKKQQAISVALPIIHIYLSYTTAITASRRRQRYPARATFFLGRTFAVLALPAL